MKLSEYAKKHGVTYRTAYNHYKNGWIKNAKQLESGTIIIYDEFVSTKNNEYIVTYSRVSCSENKDNLERQSQRLSDFCFARGWVVNESISEIASGLNDKRPKLNKILSNRRVTKIIVEHKDRLTRFGFNYLQILLKNYGCEIIVINEADNDTNDLIQDFISIITSFCARIYGQRRTKRKTEKIIKELSLKI